MVDLLNGEKSTYTEDKNIKSEQKNDQNFFDSEKKDDEKVKKNIKKKSEKELSVYDLPIKKANINRYKDRGGLTMKKLQFGLWFVKNRKSMITLGYGLLIIISVLTWSNFFYHFGYYFIVGMKADDKLVTDLINTTIVGHDYALNNSPRDLRLSPVEVLKSGENKFDLLTKVTNPNKNNWARFNYSFQIGENEYGQNNSFILPGETKHLVALNVEPISGMENNLSFNLLNTNWFRIDKHIYSNWENFRNEHMNITATDIKFIPAKTTNLSEKLNLSELNFTVNNNTVYNYWKVDFLILLFNRTKIIGVDKYRVETFQSEESKSVRITWPGAFGAVHDVEIIPIIDIVADDIYMKFDGGTPMIR